MMNRAKKLPQRNLSPQIQSHPPPTALDVGWIMHLLRQTAREHRNILYSAQALDHPLLPFINRAAGLAGISQPLWRHTAAIRTTLRLLGQDI